jgi:hypothetical protein
MDWRVLRRRKKSFSIPSPCFSMASHLPGSVGREGNSAEKEAKADPSPWAPWLRCSGGGCFWSSCMV